MKTFLSSFILLFAVFTLAPSVEAGRGCCSGHGGDCGCKASGQMSCCDGSESPGCKCTSTTSTKSSASDKSKN